MLFIVCKGILKEWKRRSRELKLKKDVLVSGERNEADEEIVESDK